MKQLDTTEKLYHPEEAEAIAQAMRKLDPEWSYVVVHDPKGTSYSYIDVYDEDGEFVAKL
jgi:hypothetical protein